MYIPPILWHQCTMIIRGHHISWRGSLTLWGDDINLGSGRIVGGGSCGDTLGWNRIMVGG